MNDTTSTLDALVDALNREADAHAYFADNADLRMTTGDHAARAQKIRDIAAALAQPAEAFPACAYDWNGREWLDPNGNPPPVSAQPAEAVEGGLPPMQSPIPTKREAHEAIQRALTDATKALRVLSIMLKKEKIMQGYAVADEILGSIGYAEKMNTALKDDARDAAQGAVAWIFERMHVVRYADEAHEIEGAVEWRPEASVEYPHALVRQEWARNVRPLTHPQAAPAQGVNGKSWSVGDRVVWTSKFGREFTGTVAAAHEPVAIRYEVNLDDGTDCTAFAHDLAAAPSQEGE